MASSIILKVKPEDLKNKSGEIKTKIGKIESYFGKIEETMLGTKKYWEGEASTQHIKSYEKLKKDAEKIILRLKEHPDDLEKMAGIYEETEKAAQQVAEALPMDLFD